MFVCDPLADKSERILDKFSRYDVFFWLIVWTVIPRDALLFVTVTQKQKRLDLITFNWIICIKIVYKMNKPWYNKKMEKGQIVLA